MKETFFQLLYFFADKLGLNNKCEADVFNIFRIDLCKCHSALPYNNYTSVKKMSKNLLINFCISTSLEANLILHAWKIIESIKTVSIYVR